MKKIFAIGLLALGMVSCDMDFYSSDTMTSAQLATNPAAAVYTTDGIYSLLQDKVPYMSESGMSGNYYIRHYFQLTEFRSDNVTISGVTEDPFIFPYVYDDDPNEKNITYTWWLAYKVINAANSNIDAIKPGASAYSDHLLGENYFFRAMMHFHLVTLFAQPYCAGRENLGVVLRNNLDISTTSRATVGEVYDQVVADLIKAKEYLANGEAERIKAGFKGYVSRDAAQALLSRVYLYMDKNDECIAECEDLLGHASATVDGGYDFADYPTHTYDHPETIWCLRLDENHEWYGEHAEAAIASMYIKDINGWGENFWSERLIDNFQRYPEDKRFAGYFRMVGTDGQIHTMAEMKEIAAGKVTVTFPVKTKDDNPYCSSGVSMDRTPNADGSVPFVYLSKNYTAVPTIENGYTVYYCNDAGFPGEKIDGKARVFVRPNTNRAEGIRSKGGDYIRYYNTKFSYQDGKSMISSPVFLRWGEVVLNYAEALAKKDRGADALAQVNRIRHRAGLTGDADFTTANYGDRGYGSILEVVLDERNRELCFEGHRNFDLFRNKMAMDRRFVGYHPWEVIQWNDPRVVLLISQDEINASGIPQNPR